jgi:hypothetical protein
MADMLATTNTTTSTNSKMPRPTALLLSLLSVVAAAHAHAPAPIPLSSQAQAQLPFWSAAHGLLDSAVDISGSAFLGLTTFANLQYVSCFSAADNAEESYDIAVMGAPFDTVSWLDVGF